MSEPLLFDTDVLIDVGRGVQAAVDTLETVSRQNRVRISVVTEMELLVGCRNKDEQHTLYDFLDTCGAKILQLHPTISATAVELMQMYQLSHDLRIADALIAATAHERDCPLITKNQKDFQYIDGLNLPSYPPSIS